ncbi:hypothetical protein Tco_0270138 [Tanacetum coccineum]
MEAGREIVKEGKITQKTSHLHAVKGGSLDSEKASLDRNIHKRRLSIPWQEVDLYGMYEADNSSNSTTESEYGCAANCCGTYVIDPNQKLDNGYYGNMQAVWIGVSSVLELNFAGLEIKDKKELAIPGQTTTGKEFSNPVDVNSVKQMHAIVDGKAVVITESSVRNDILFDDEDGITCLANDEFFENLVLMGCLTGEREGLAAWRSKIKKIVKKIRNDRGSHDLTSKKERVFQADSDFDDLDDLVDEGMDFVQEKDAENQGKIGADDTDVVKGSGDTEAVNTAGEGISTTAPKTPPTTTIEEKAKEKGVAIKDVKDSSRPIRSITTLQPFPTIDPKDKGKGILQDTKHVEKTKKMVQGDAQIERDAEVALRLQAELDAELKVERERQEEASKVAIAEMFDEVQARIDADYELAARMTQKEQGKYTIEERSRLLAEFFERRKKQLAAERNMGGYTHNQLKGKSYKEIQGLYERQQKRIQDFTPMDSDKEAQKSGKRLKRVTGSYATQKSPKKPKVMKSAKDVTEEEAIEYEKEKEELRLSLKIISNDDSEVNYEPLSRKFPIVNWEYQLLGKIEEKDMYVYKLTRADGSSSYHGDTQAFLRRLDRQDLNDLYRLVQERFQDHPLEGHDLLLWGDLRMIFDPDEKDELWMNQLDWKLLRWKLYESCGVHTLFMDGKPMEINMLVEKKYPLVKELLEKMLNLQLQAEEESTMAFELIKFIKSLLEE